MLLSVLIDSVFTLACFGGFCCLCIPVPEGTLVYSVFTLACFGCFCCFCIPVPKGTKDYVEYPLKYLAWCGCCCLIIACDLWIDEPDMSIWPVKVAFGCWGISAFGFIILWIVELCKKLCK